MKIISLSLFVFIFVVVPIYMLNYVVMPALDQLQHNYSTMGDAASKIADTN